MKQGSVSQIIVMKQGSVSQIIAGLTPSPTHCCALRPLSLQPAHLARLRFGTYFYFWEHYISSSVTMELNLWHMFLLLGAPYIFQRENRSEVMAHDFALIMELKLWHMVLLLGAPHVLQRDIGTEVTAHGFASGSTTYLTA